MSNKHNSHSYGLVYFKAALLNVNQPTWTYSCHTCSSTDWQGKQQMIQEKIGNNTTCMQFLVLSSNLIVVFILGPTQYEQRAKWGAVHHVALDMRRVEQDNFLSLFTFPTIS